MDEYEVESAADQQITGTTTAAAGTSFIVRVESTETPGEGFVLSDQDEVVQEGGSWNAMDGLQ